jgi:hypothetical protein
MDGGGAVEVRHWNTDVNGVSIHVSEQGPTDGKVVLLLHGFPSSDSSGGARCSPLPRARSRPLLEEEEESGTGARGPWRRILGVEARWMGHDAAALFAGGEGSTAALAGRTELRVKEQEEQRRPEEGEGTRGKKMTSRAHTLVIGREVAAKYMYLYTPAAGPEWFLYVSRGIFAWEPKNCNGIFQNM